MINLQHISKSYQLGGEQLKVLNNISLAICAGDYLSIMGPSGSGKSTLLNMLGLLDRPDTGQYLLNGIATTAADEEQRAALRREHIGFIFQSFHLIPRLSAQENVELPLMLSNISPQERQARVAQVLSELGLSDRCHHLPKELSGGQLQRVAIARALVMKPDILLADEPTGNLDQHSGLEVIHLLEQLNSQGITLVIVTHDKNLGTRAKRQLNMVDGVLSEHKLPLEAKQTHALAR
jgi:putative ABC transport system ATP-binding protein